MRVDSAKESIFQAVRRRKVVEGFSCKEALHPDRQFVRRGGASSEQKLLGNDRSDLHLLGLSIGDSA